MSSIVAKRCTAWATRLPYGIGWRTDTTRFPRPRSARTTARLVWLLPAPVRDAQTATTGLLERSMVWRGPNSI